MQDYTISLIQQTVIDMGEISTSYMYSIHVFLFCDPKTMRKCEICKLDCALKIVRPAHHQQNICVEDKQVNQTNPKFDME